MRLVAVAPPAVGYVFAAVETEFRARGHEVVRHGDEAAFLAARDALDGADLLCCMGTLRCSRALLAAAKQLRAVVTPFIGADAFDVGAATELGVVIANGQVPENYLSMAEATVMLMLAALYNLHEKEDSFRHNLPRPQRQSARMLRGKTVGLIGMGRVARAIADRLAPWEVRIVAYAPRAHAPFPPHVARVELDELLRASDIVSIHATLNRETRGLLGAERLALLKPDAVLLNTARGGIADEAALVAWAIAHPEGRVVLDVYEQEPLPPDLALRGLKNAILTPHLVGHTRETAAAVPQAAIDNIARALAGEPPLYVLNPEVLPMWRRRWSAP